MFLVISLLTHHLFNIQSLSKLVFFGTKVTGIIPNTPFLFENSNYGFSFQICLRVIAPMCLPLEERTQRVDGIGQQQDNRSATHTGSRESRTTGVAMKT